MTLPGEDAIRWWLTGLVDGEGCFFANLGGRRDRPYDNLVVSFFIGLRADDAATVERARALIPVGRIQRRTHTISKPTVVWTVSDAPGLLEIVRHFDAYPLQSKKARDYAAWRELVMLKQEHPPGCRVSVVRAQPDLVRALVTQIREGRTYQEVVAV